jgi:imidazolonepropionase
MTETLAASDDELLTLLTEKLRQQLQHGITHVEVKSGYAPDARGELRLLRVLKKAQNSELPIALLPTFLGLHALPKGRSESEFVDEMISILPEIKKEGLAHFIDAFPEKGFFTLEESLRFAAAGLKHGLVPKIHADELSPLGSAEAFSKLGAFSVDHLQKISEAGKAELAKSKTVATLLPATSFFLDLEYSPARDLLTKGARVALATDYNPGTAPDLSPQFTMRLAASQLKMTPAEIFCAFTYNGAAALGLDQEAGIIAPQQKANLCLWKVTPKHALEEIVVAGPKPTEVFFSGRPATRALSLHSPR